MKLRIKQSGLKGNGLKVSRKNDYSYLLRPQERIVSKDRNIEPKYSLPSPTSNTPGKEACHSPPAYYAIKLTQVKFPQTKNRKRKRSQEDEAALPSTATPSQKRLRTSLLRSPNQETISENTAVGISGKEINPLEYWRKELRWPKEYFEPESNMNHLLARKKSSSSFRGKQSEAGSAAPSSTTPSDQKPREAKSLPYARPSYETVLATKGSFIGKFELGITDESKRLCRTLLEAEQSVPQETLFRDDLFEETCETVRARNEAMVVRDISLLIYPSAQVLRIYGTKHLKPLNESVNEGWNSAIPFYGPRPQPDYSVGFGRSAFTDDQLEKLRPFVGEVTDIFTSYFMATWQTYFPFLTCEVKCGAAALDIADRQNAYSMILAVRGTVELFRLVKREKELYREILAFSISHDHRTVRIYGHYPVIDGKKTTFYRYPIREFSFTELDGKEKWTVYKFTKNVYDIWMPTYLKRICSVIDNLLPDLDFEVSQQSELGESGLSQGFESHYLSDQTSHDAVSLREAGSQSSPVGSRDVPTDTSLSQRTEGGEFKKPKKRARS
ncbi:phosphatidylserine decarboxylase protein [Rutstroemia sp. NJR-2017a BVV2]|nr:phosphatidylserine decarboxylase protein [Rutstroemia sp. NJR-2017a BVV2]